LLTVLKNARSIPYLTSADVISRLTGGENFTPVRSFTVTVLLSGETSGSEAARSGTGCVGSPGL
jgi:hypothetical protein